MIESGQVESFQQLTELGRISQPRMTQIMSLLLFAPDIQDELLHLPEVMQGKATIHEWSKLIVRGAVGYVLTWMIAYSKLTTLPSCFAPSP